MSGAATNDRRIDQLLESARSRLESSGRPSQVSLRRSVSDIYYAAFHFLVDRCTTQMLGVSAGAAIARDAMARGFSHTAVRKACRAFGSGGPLPKTIDAASRTLPRPIGRFARCFVDAQFARHAADYDWNHTFAKAEVISLEIEVATAIEEFRLLDRSDPDLKFFIAMVTVWGGLP